MQFEEKFVKFIPSVLLRKGKNGGTPPVVEKKSRILSHLAPGLACVATVCTLLRSWKFAAGRRTFPVERLSTLDKKKKKKERKRKRREEKGDTRSTDSGLTKKLDAEGGLEGGGNRVCARGTSGNLPGEHCWRNFFTFRGRERERAEKLS